MRIIIIALIIIAITYYLTIYRIRTRTHNMLMVGILTLALIPTAVMEARWQVLENIGTRTVAAVSGDAEGNLHCQRLTETFLDAKQNRGHVMLDNPNQAVLKHTPCQHLFSYITSDKSSPSTEQVQAVHVLTHETIHVQGDYNETSTECTAVQNDVRTVVALGGTAEQGEMLAREYYETVYPRMPGAYHSADCVENGALDLTPDDGNFFR